MLINKVGTAKTKPNIQSYNIQNTLLLKFCIFHKCMIFTNVCSKDFKLTHNLIQWIGTKRGGKWLSHPCSVSWIRGKLLDQIHTTIGQGALTIDIVSLPKGESFIKCF